ncbi:hypothetical protein BK816_02695 [Boudabousia tangfeifanii]|uniref:Uncharacterized protein n=1 Tax=Boudabousia tangfeifanii TaxID=1912795 RepID=A0A1D9MJ79_9ACTO|nr:hypothetical protein [Boudabousia tangfeifanii]AOZ72342.1 hypothetical protein BK816_02695 [Boudabousia tangfeifanii]
MARTYNGCYILDENYGSVLDVLLPAIGEDPNCVYDSQWNGGDFFEMAFYLFKANKVGCRIADKYLDMIADDGEFTEANLWAPGFDEAVAENRTLGPDPWPLAAKIIER